MKQRNYCFTYHNYDDKTKDILITAHNKNHLKSVKFAIWQLEKGEETGAFHLQGYIELLGPMRLKAVKKEIFGDSKSTVHLEPRKGNRMQAIDYCRKAETRVDGPWTFGDISITQGTRTDIKKMITDIKSGKNMFEILEDNPVTFCKYVKGAMAIKSIYDKQDGDRDVKVQVNYGACGSGKTRDAMKNRKSTFKLDLDDSDKVWFDGYDGETTLVIDDFYGQMKASYLLKILDRYPLNLPVKGSTVWAKWTNVIITSNVHPKKWYNSWANIPEKAVQGVMRRIHKIVYYPKKAQATKWVDKETYQEPAIDTIKCTVEKLK